MGRFLGKINALNFVVYLKSRTLHGTGGLVKTIKFGNVILNLSSKFMRMPNQNCELELHLQYHNAYERDSLHVFGKRDVYWI